MKRRLIMFLSVLLTLVMPAARASSISSHRHAVESEVNHEMEDVDDAMHGQNRGPGGGGDGDECSAESADDDEAEAEADDADDCGADDEADDDASGHHSGSGGGL